MTMPPLPAAGDPDWRDDWAQAVHDAATEVTVGRLTEGAQSAAFGRPHDVLDAVREFGLAPGNTAADNATRLANAFAAAIAGNLECYIGPGTFPVSNGLHWNDQTVRLRGAGSKNTLLVFPSNTDNGLRVGNSTFDNDLGSDGWVKGIGLWGPGMPGAKNGKAAFVADSTHFLSVEGLYAGGFDVAYDMVNNNYGIEWRNVHTRYQVCNLGLRLRTGAQSGNDIPFYNCWLAGAHHAVSVEPAAGDGTDGFHFYAGQLSGGQAAADQNSRGVLHVGVDYMTGAASGGEATRVTLHDTTFEHWRRQWAIYTAGPVDMDLHGVGFFSADLGVENALGVLRHAGPYHDNIQFRHCMVGGPYKTALLDLAPDIGGSNPTFMEIGTRGRPTVAGTEVDLYARGMFDRMNLARGIALSGGTKSTLMLDRMRLRSSAAGPQFSSNGTVWIAGAHPLYRNLLTLNQSTASTDVSSAVLVSCTVARETTVVPQPGADPAVYKLTSTNGSTGSVGIESATPTFGVAGDQVTARALVLADTPAKTRQVRIYVDWYNAAGTYLSGTEGETVAESAAVWTPLEVTGVAPATATRAAVYVEFLNVPGGSAEVHYVSRLTVARTA